MFSTTGPKHAEAPTRTLERQKRLMDLLADPAVDREAFVARPSNRRGARPTTRAASGALYTALYSPGDRAVEYRWSGVSWRQGFDRCEEGSREVLLPTG